MQENPPTLEEKTLHGAIMQAVNSVVEDGGEFVQAFRENVLWVIGSYSANEAATEFDDLIEKQQKRVLELVGQSECADDEFERRHREIAEELLGLRQKRMKLLQNKQMADIYEERLDGMEEYVRKAVIWNDNLMMSWFGSCCRWLRW